MKNKKKSQKLVVSYGKKQHATIARIPTLLGFVQLLQVTCDLFPYRKALRSLMSQPHVTVES